MTCGVVLALLRTHKFAYAIDDLGGRSGGRLAQLVIVLVARLKHGINRVSNRATELVDANWGALTVGHRFSLVCFDGKVTQTKASATSC